MATGIPSISALVTPVPNRDGFLVSPPIAWPTVAEQLHAENSSAVDGHHKPEKGETHGTAVPKLQDTFISGSSGRTGKPFTVTTGTVKDDWKSPRTSQYGLLVADSATTFDIVATNPDSRIVNAQIIVRRGANPVANSPTAANFYTYIELCKGNNYNYRIAAEWGKPIRLDVWINGAWAHIEHTKFAPDTETFFASEGSRLTLEVIADYYDNILTVRVNGATTLKYKDPNGLATFGNPRFMGQNGWATFEYYPLRFQALGVTKSARNFGQPVPAGAGTVVLNSRGNTNPTQTVTGSVTGDGQSVGYSLTAQLPDAGDGLGSTDPPKLVDATLVIPSQWQYPFGLGTAYQIGARKIEILETMNDATRTFSSSAMIVAPNYASQYTGSYGHAAVDIAISTGYDSYLPAFSGIAGVGQDGLQFTRKDPVRDFGVPCADNSYKMQVPLGQEVCFDGWCIYSAVRFLCECGNIHPKFLQTIPLYVPPGTTSDAPYGPAGSDCPFYILGRGTGLNAKYKFLPDWTPWQVLQRLVQDAGDTDFITGGNVPYFMGFTPSDNQFRFQAYNPRYQPVVAAYLQNDPTGYNQIEEIQVFNSIYQMRTDIVFQGIDAFTNELLFYHLPMPASVMQAVGFRYAWMERDVRFASRDFMITIANNAAAQASLPTQVVTVRVPYHPYVRAGHVCIISEGNALGRTGLFYIIEIRSSVGINPDGSADSFSYVTARAIENF